MQKTVIRAQIYHLLTDPGLGTKNPEAFEQSYEYLPDGLLVVQNGKIHELGSYEHLKDKYSSEQIIDRQNYLLTPGFVDTHVHYPQTEMIASYGEQLLEWLETYTYPTEKKFSDKGYAKKISALFLNELLFNGTTTALVFPTVHPESVEAFFEEADERNLRMICGKVLMDRNCPSDLRDTAQTGYTESKQLIEKWHKKNRLLYAVTPRFAPTSTPEQLQMAKKLLSEYKDLYLHTHLAENKDEIKWVQELFPDSKSYLDVYNQYGLVTNKSVFAHCLHLEVSDFECMQEKDAAISFCPTSNMFLGSGFFKMAQAQKMSVKVGLGTDIGAGTTFSLLQTMNEAYKVVKLQKAFAENPKEILPLNPHKAFYLGTLGGAKALSLESKIGNFEIGKEADFILLDPSSDPILKYRINNTKDISEKLFALMMIGGKNIIAETYILGERISISR